MYQCGKTYGVGLKTWFSLIGLLLTVTRDHKSTTSGGWRELRGPQ